MLNTQSLAPPLPLLPMLLGVPFDRNTTKISTERHKIQCLRQQHDMRRDKKADMVEERERQEGGEAEGKGSGRHGLRALSDEDNHLKTH